MSTLKTNNIEHLDATSPSIVVNAAGGIQVGGALTATTGTFSGNVSVAGVLSYEDVANIDSVGIITAQSGINVTGGNVDVGNILANIGGVRTNIDGSVVINPASSLSNTAQRFILYKDRSANTDMAVVFTKAGRADFAGRLYSNEWFQADRTSGTNSAFYATVSGVEKLNIRANGSASFAAGAFAIESDGDISTNIRSHGNVELDSSGAFTSPKIKLFAATGAATFEDSGTFGSYIVSTRFTVNGSLSSNVNGVNYPFSAYDSSSNLYASISESGAAIFASEVVAGVRDVNCVLMTSAGTTQGVSGGVSRYALSGANGNATFAGSVISGSLSPGGGGGNYFSGGEVAAYSPNATYHVWRAWNASSSPNVLTSQIYANGNAVFAGSVSKGSGSFRIDHPLPAKTETHHLVHSFIEGPQADLIYRGVVDLVGGTATVNVDTAGRMTEGTFAALCTNVSCFTSNESDWTAVKGSVTGNILTITAQDNASTSKVSWMVVGERKDQHMIDTDWTDENGRVIIEPLKS